MMKILTTNVLFIYIIYRTSADNQTYSSKYDEVNLDEILASERLLNGYVNCLLDIGPCTPDGKELKRNLPDAIENDCKRCTERQKEGSDKVMHYIIDHRPDDWAQLEKKYNSDGHYKKKYIESKSSKDVKPQSKENDDADEDEEQNLKEGK